MAQIPYRPSRTPIPIGGTPAAALPSERHPAWAGLITGSIRHNFIYAAAGMLLFNLNLQWKHDPSRLAPLIQQLRNFFQKYHHLLENDIHKLFS